jgi:23S rRNA (uracil1939-C5)-methyltransferase
MRDELFELTIAKLVHGGQGIADLPDGRKVFVWNALPGERVRARIIKQKRSYAEAIAEEILVASSDRIPPEEDNYLATSPWQIMDFAVENHYKSDIVRELFAHEKVSVPGFDDAVTTGDMYHYRNKMEYSFWGDEQGLHLALHQRGSHGKQIVEGSKLALPAVDVAASAILRQLNDLGIRAGSLKTIIVRSSQDGRAVCSLFTKDESFPEVQLPAEVQGLRIYHSNPKSPASVPTKLLQEYGDVHLNDTLLGKSFTYDADSFFQVNLPVFETALGAIKQHINDENVTDMYAGVGSIGLSVASRGAQLVELDPATAAMARVNAAASGLETEVIETSTEKALDYISAERPVMFDPPRAGLHANVVARTLEARPSQVIYLSCNPATQARDLAQLQQGYDITHFTVYNFFPRTPHIETLAVLQAKN